MGSNRSTTKHGRAFAEPRILAGKKSERVIHGQGEMYGEKQRSVSRADFGESLSYIAANECPRSAARKIRGDSNALVRFAPESPP